MSKGKGQKGISIFLRVRPTKKPSGYFNFDREEVYWINRGRHPSHIEMNLHADSEGRLCGIETDALIDGGGFASFGHVTTYYNGVLHTAPYEIGAFHYTGARVWTNKPASGAMRCLLYTSPSPRDS